MPEQMIELEEVAMVETSDNALEAIVTGVVGGFSYMNDPNPNC